MPSLPFTFDEMRKKLSPGDHQKVTEPAEADAQNFLSNSIDKLKKRLSTADGMIDTALAINPVTRYTDMASKFFGGPGIQEGFKEGVIQKDKVNNKTDIVLPPMPF